LGGRSELEGERNWWKQEEEDEAGDGEKQMEKSRR